MSSYTDYIKTENGFWIVEASENQLKKLRWEEKKPILKIKRNLLTDSSLMQLRGYFDGNIKKFDLDLDFSPYTSFQQKVWQELTKIPYGQTISYLHLAQRLGNPLAIRAAASANGKNPFPVIIPCHRVIGKDGSLTGYAYGIDLKSKLLQLEGAITNHQLNLFG